MGYLEEVLVDEPRRYYRLGETSGTSATDLGRDGAHGAYSGGFTLNQGGALLDDADPSVLLNGSTGYVSIPAFTLGGKPGAFECWFRPAAFDGVLIGRDGGGGYIDPRNATSIDVQLSSTVTFTVPAMALLNWYHLLVAFYADGTCRLWLNGKESSSGALSVSGSIAFDRIGRYSGGSGFWYNGRIDEVQFYDYVPREDRVLSHYTEGRARGYEDEVYRDDPMMVWRLDDAAGPVADVYGQRPGTMVGSLTFGETSVVPADTRRTVRWPGGNNYLRGLSSLSQMDPGTGDFRFELWLKSFNTTTGPIYEIVNRDPGSSGSYQMVRVNSAGKIYSNTAGGVVSPAASQPSVMDTQVHHLVYQRASGTVEIWQDGTRWTSGSLPGNIAASQELRLGQCDGSQTPWNGWFQYMSYAKAALTEAQIRRHYAARFVPPLSKRIFA